MQELYKLLLGRLRGREGAAVLFAARASVWKRRAEERRLGDPLRLGVVYRVLRCGGLLGLLLGGGGGEEEMREVFDSETT